MSVAEDLLTEMHTWRAAWRQIEIFLDRIDEMRKKDAPHAARTKALLRAIAFLHLEARWRSGWHLDLPFEMAVAGEGPPDVWDDGVGWLVGFGSGYRPASATDIDIQVNKDSLDHRLPGLFDIELAAAPLALPRDEDPSSENVKDIRLSPTYKLFTRYDVDHKDWVPVEFPVYHFGALPAVITVDSEVGMFPRAARMNIVLDSLKTDIPPADDPTERPPNHPTLWSVYKCQKNIAEFKGLQPLSNGGSSETAAILHSACKRGRVAAIQARELIDKEDVGPAADADKESVIETLKMIETGFSQLAPVYEKMATGSGGPENDEERRLLEDPLIDPFRLLTLEAVLDQSVDAQIAYPDGSLRQLRTLEWTFLMSYNARLPWFWYRRERALKPLLARFLKTFRQSLFLLRKGEPTTFPYFFSLNRAAAVGDASVQLGPPRGALAHDLSKIIPGQIAFLQGHKSAPDFSRLLDPALHNPVRAAALQQERSTAVLVLGVDPPLRVNGDVIQRLRISPLRVSLATGKEIPGSAGLIPSGAVLSPGPPGISDADLRAGTSATSPGDDGTIQEIVSVWSKLCLLVGTQAVETHPTLGVSLPSPLPRATHVPVYNIVKPAADRVLVLVKDLVALGFDPRKPHFARPGEMLLLRGRAAAEDDGSPGDLWQTAVEVQGVVRVTEEQAVKDLSVVTLPCPLCCDGPGELLAVLISDPKIPVDLVSEVFLHRDFLGFGTPSLSSEHILPIVVDPDSSTLSDTVYRGPELDVAVSVLKHWLGDRAAP